MKLKCTWSTKNAILENYHDKIWGKPCFSDQELFKCLVIQIFQSGLDLRTVLTKLEALNEMFDEFKVQTVAGYDQSKLEALMACPLIIRNQRKIKAVIHNADVILKMSQTGMSFNDFIWSKVDFVPMDLEPKNNAKMMFDLPIARRVCKDMQELGFQFVGPTNISFFLQASGIINTHWVNCSYR